MYYDCLAQTVRPIIITCFSLFMAVAPWSVDGYFVPYYIFFSPPIRMEHHMDFFFFIFSLSEYFHENTNFARITYTAGGGVCLRFKYSMYAFMVVNIFAFRREPKSFFFFTVFKSYHSFTTIKKKLKVNP